MKKKRMILFMSFVLSFTLWFLPSAEVAANNSSEAILEQAASEIIQKSHMMDADGVTSTTYTNIDQFIKYIHDNYEDISDNEIALFVRTYTKQIYEGLEETEILEILSLDNITTTVEYITASPDGNGIENRTGIRPYWIDNTQTIEIITSYSYRKTVGDEKYYKIWASATWLDKPLVAIRDVFGLGTTGTFDSSYTVKGSVYQTLQCLNGCTSRTYNNRSVQSNDESDDDLKLRYDEGFPYIQYVPANASCAYCLRNTQCTYLSTYIEYGMLTNESVSIQAGYGHSRVSCNASISFDANGLPSISPSASIRCVPYVALPVTVFYNWRKHKKAKIMIEI